MIDADNVRLLFDADDAFKARKTALTEFLGELVFTEREEILTTDGLVSVDPGHYFIALDAEGNPYPVKASVFKETYERVAA